MKKVLLIVSFVIGCTIATESKAQGRFVISVNIGAPVYGGNYGNGYACNQPVYNCRPAHRYYNYAPEREYREDRREFREERRGYREERREYREEGRRYR